MYLSWKKLLLYAICLSSCQPPFNNSTTPSIPIPSLLNAPLNPKNNAKQDVVRLLGQLEIAGLVAQHNVMGIEELLNPASKSIIVKILSDEEICKSVQQRCHEAELGEAQGANNSKFGDDTVRAKLTRKEGLTAASIIQGYFADINDPFLVSWRHFLHNLAMKHATILLKH